MWLVSVTGFKLFGCAQPLLSVITVVTRRPDQHLKVHRTQTPLRYIGANSLPVDPALEAATGP
jgi:hypothetical protein